MSQKLGKAKRLQQARAAKCGQTFTTQDVTGHDIEVRHSGMTFTEFFNHMRSMYDTNSRPRNDKDATVPCNGCTICCHHDRIEVLPWLELPEHLAQLSTEPDPDGCSPDSLKLKRRENGACIHLGEHGCTVYEHRPTACRVYDCRYTNFLGVTLCYEGYEEPMWLFDIETRADDVIAAARLQIVEEASAMTEYAEAVPYAAHRLAQLRAEYKRLFGEYDVQLAKMTPKERAEHECTLAKKH